MQIILKTGQVIESKKDGDWDYFPALQDVYPEIEDACSVCPLADIVCCRNNGYDCMSCGMLDGFYCDMELALNILPHLTQRARGGGERPENCDCFSYALGWHGDRCPARRPRTNRLCKQ